VIFYKDWSGTSPNQTGPPKLVGSSHRHQPGRASLVLPPRLDRSDYSEPCIAQPKFLQNSNLGNFQTPEEGLLVVGLLNLRKCPEPHTLPVFAMPHAELSYMHPMPSQSFGRCTQCRSLVSLSDCNCTKLSLLT